MKPTTPTTHEAEPCAATKPTKSKGERFFDWVVYGGIAGVGTFVATLYISNKFLNGTWAGPRYQKAVDALEGYMASVFSKSFARSAAQEAVQTTSLMMGGNAMLVPIAAAEHYKSRIVGGLNVMLDDKTPPEAVTVAPKQTARSLIEGRLVAWGAVFSALMGASLAVPKSFALFQNEVGERFHSLVQYMRKKPPLPTLEAMEKTTSFRVGKIAALDVFATAAGATLLYVAGHTFARKREERKQHPERRHTVLGGLPDAVEADAPMKSEGPETTLEGARSHEGKTQGQPLVVAAQV